MESANACLTNLSTKKPLKVREGNTGILYFTDSNGKQERYIPDYNLDKARELLLEFQQLRDGKGKCLKDNYWREGYNWYPTMVSNLYWHMFFRYVQYKPIINKAADDELNVQFQNEAFFYNIFRLFSKQNKQNSIKIRILYFLIRLNNRIVIRKYPVQLLFFRFARDDFRSVEIRKTLEDIGTEYIQVVPPGRICELVADHFKKKPYYYFGNDNVENKFNHGYDLIGIEPQKKRLFKKAIEHLEVTVSGLIKEYKVHLKQLNNTQAKTFFGFDDCNDYVFPILYACQRKHIITIGYQHGASYTKLHGGYEMKGIGQPEYKWFNKVIVWGEYWKAHLLSISKAYQPDMFVVGGNKLSWDYGTEAKGGLGRRNILVPYESVTNTYKVGRYMVRLMDLGYNIYFKPRPDEEIEDQLEAYCLSSNYRNRIDVVKKIDPEFMRNIDIIAGTMTGLIYELLPYNKIVWILEMEFNLLEDLVEDGYAHKVKYECLDSLEEKYFVRTVVDKDYFFGPTPLRKIISSQVLVHLD